MHAVDALGAAEVHAFGEPLEDVAVDQPLDALLVLVGQLVAAGPNTSMPLSWYGLCEAEIMTPRSARIDRVSMATAGVGIGPGKSTSMPTEVKPATSAFSII